MNMMQMRMISPKKMSRYEKKKRNPMCISHEVRKVKSLPEILISSCLMMFVMGHEEGLIDEHRYMKVS